MEDMINKREDWVGVVIAMGITLFVLIVLAVCFILSLPLRMIGTGIVFVNFLKEHLKGNFRYGLWHIWVFHIRHRLERR